MHWFEVASSNRDFVFICHLNIVVVNGFDVVGVNDKGFMDS